MDCATWWSEQGQATYRYALTLQEKDRASQENTARRMVENADTWGVLTRLPEAAVAMKYHVGAMRRIADSAFMNHRRGIEIGFSEMETNILAQTALYRKSFQAFPDKEWTQAFGLYCTAGAGLTMALVIPDMAEFRKQKAVFTEVRLRLGDLWGRISDAHQLATIP